MEATKVKPVSCKLFCDRFPLGEWEYVEQQPYGVTYCGKEIRVEQEEGEKVIRMGQKGFTEGRLETVPIDSSRKDHPELAVTEMERSDFRSVLGALQWLVTQSRPDVAFCVNQLQKRVGNLQVKDLILANQVVRVVKRNDLSLVFRNLGKEVTVVGWHDAGLYNSVGVEIEDRDDEVIQSLLDKKLIYSQKGCCTGIVKTSDLEKTHAVNVNFTSWRTKTNRRVVESSFAAETHAAIMGHGSAHYQRALLCEVYYGSWVLKSDDVAWNHLIPLTLCTDCKSVYDCIKKDGHSIGDRNNALNVTVLRQLCAVQNSEEKIPTGEKGSLLWLPTRHQCADGLTKAGLAKTAQEVFGRGQATFHGESAKAAKSKRSLGQCEKLHVAHVDLCTSRFNRRNRS